MDVLFLAHSYPRTADDSAGSFLLRLAVALGEVGVHVQVLAPSAEGLADAEVIDGIPVERFRYAPRGMETLAYTGTMAEQVLGSFGGKATLAAFLACGRLALGRAVERIKPAVVHAHWWFPGGVIATTPGRLAPTVVTMHGSDVRLGLKQGAARAQARRVLQQAQAVTTVSRWLAQQAAPLTEQEVHVAPMPARTDLFTPGPDAAREAGTLLFVGRLNAQKGARLLLDAVAHAPGVTRLDVVGEGEERGALEQRAAQPDLAGRVRFLGALPQRDLVAHYRRATALAMPSTDEGLGLVAVEAALCGTPTVAFDSGGLPDVVRDGTTGWLVPPGERDPLVAALTQVMAHPDLARARGAAARVDAERRFAPRAVAERYAAVYAEAARDA